MKKYYLKSNIKFEPSVFNWPAWPQLIPPATCALNIKNRYLKILESYLEDPVLHFEASTDPSLIGAPFINVNPEEKNSIEEVYTKIKKEAIELIELADALKILNDLILQEARGESLEHLYQKIPEKLKGTVELFYDVNNLPRYRIIEQLLYNRYYNSDAQSIFLSIINQDFRPFALSTPYISSKNKIEIHKPFNDSFIDKLIVSRINPICIDTISELFQEDKNLEYLLGQFFDEYPTSFPSNRKYSGEKVRIRYFGHACVLIETAKVSILIDPLISYQYSSGLDRYTFFDLPDSIDFVLFTHAHEDHIVFETVLQIRHKVRNFVIPKDRQGIISDPSIKLLLKKTGFFNCLSLEEFESIVFEDCEIIGIPFLGEHCDLEVHSKLGYGVIAKGKKILFLADSRNIEPEIYKCTFKILGSFEYLFIGMEHVGGPLTFQYGGLITIPISNAQDQTRRLSCSDYIKALSLLKISGSREVYIYAMGLEPWLNHLMALDYQGGATPQMESVKKFIDTCKLQGVYSELLFAKKEFLL
ncbi:MAG: MBL fold metallo-hydrolase [Candidatus Megaira endosymbiont of Mesostigma viride]|nr:MAG: MBL fold metallo-hydrolase [Candidatus Megaira endosymbiont of Mesostigma viride]HJK88189.1 MBL fold metallo-hydrolase [Candidatus Megaira endosymbiont of Mesostigma viride]